MSNATTVKINEKSGTVTITVPLKSVDTLTKSGKNRMIASVSEKVQVDDLSVTVGLNLYTPLI